MPFLDLVQEGNWFYVRQIEAKALESLRKDMRGLRSVLCEKVEKSG